MKLQSVETTKAVVQDLEASLRDLTGVFARESIMKDDVIDKLCRELDEMDSLFHEKSRILEGRLAKSTAVLDGLLARRTKTRQLRMQEIDELEKSIANTRKSIESQKIEHAETLSRIYRLIDSQLIDFVATT